MFPSKSQVFLKNRLLSITHGCSSDTKGAMQIVLPQKENGFVLEQASVETVPVLTSKLPLPSTIVAISMGCLKGKIIGTLVFFFFVFVPSAAGEGLTLASTVPREGTSPRKTKVNKPQLELCLFPTVVLCGWMW